MLRVRRCHAVRDKQRHRFRRPYVKRCESYCACNFASEQTQSCDTSSQKGQSGYQIKRSLEPSQSLDLTEVRGREFIIPLRSSSAVNGSCVETEPGL